jgi:ferrous iron transport protein A
VARPAPRENENHFQQSSRMQSASIPLSELPVGGRAFVVAIEGTPELTARLGALGFLPRTEVRCRRRAPLGDPRVYELRGTQLCLRRSEARSVRVELA